MKQLAIRPRQHACIRTCIRNNSVQNGFLRSPGLPETNANHRQGFASITSIVREGSATDASRFILPADANEERMPSRRFRLMEHGDGTAAGRDHFPIGKADPLISVLFEELVADGPVLFLILATVGMNLPEDFRWQLVGNAFHHAPR